MIRIDQITSVRIEGDGTFHNTHIFVNGSEVPVKSINLNMDADRNRNGFPLTEVTLHLRRLIDIPEELQASLTFHGLPLKDEVNRRTEGWESEREQAVKLLREISRYLGDKSEWPDELHMYDILDKHIRPYLP